MGGNHGEWADGWMEEVSLYKGREGNKRGRKHARKKEKERMLELYRRETSGQNGYELKAYTEPHMSW